MERKRQSTNRKSRRSAGGDPRKRLLELEKGTYLKKWTGRLPIALVYPNTYQVGMSSLGFQLVYRLLNEMEHVVCERFFLPERGSPVVSIESGRTLDNFPTIFFSVSFEHDYINLVSLFRLTGIEPFERDRLEEIAPGNPLVICGGVATFMNPEPLAPFVDLFAIGEAEMLIEPLVSRLTPDGMKDRRKLTRCLNHEHDGFYAPRFYQPLYTDDRLFKGFEVEEGLPERIRKVILPSIDTASHSEVLTPDTEFADLYLTELGRGCSRGCRFCAAGFIYRPPRLWSREAISRSLAERPERIDRVGLLGMEMTERSTLDTIAGQMSRDSCSLSFSSLRADRISDNLLDLLSTSGLKSVAIAPDGASERLRRVINKGLSEKDLIDAAARLTKAGLYRLKLYLMIGLPSEDEEDLREFVDLVKKIRRVIDPIGRQRGRLCELVISANSFVPKPWTPFQYHPYGISENMVEGESIKGSKAVARLKAKIGFLKKGFAGMANTRFRHDNPDHVMFQAVLARGDRRLARVLLNMIDSGMSWKQAMKEQDLGENLFITRQFGPAAFFPWYIIDHSINDSYLWQEYCRSTEARLTVPCDTRLCRRCGVCKDGTESK